MSSKLPDPFAPAARADSGSQARAKPERSDDGTGSGTGEPPLDLVIEDLREMGFFAHLPGEEEIARTRGMLEDGWTVAREVELPNVEAVPLLLALLRWVGSRGLSSPARKVAVQLVLSLDPPPGPMADPAAPEPAAGELGETLPPPSAAPVAMELS